MLMMRVSKRDKKLVIIIAVALGLTQLITLIMNEFMIKADLIFKTDQLVFLALIIALFPPAIINYVDMRWRLSIDKNIPEFLRELSEAGRTGVTLTRALDLASKRRYGPLSSELERIVTKLSWGGNFEDSLKKFAERIETKLAKRTSILLTEINRSGGDIKDVLDTISRHIRELQSIEDERRSQLQTYVGIVYIAFFIFIFIDYILLQTFFAKIEALKESLSDVGGLFLMKELSYESIKTIMFHMSIMQGLFGGLIAGKMGEGALGAGLKHSLILITIAFLMFYFIM
ncbi:type II secretion system F family protein [Candidatus Bathyarchaeota archaeon]|nr:type II secretion system F family protein [Candidatus Bathyarchaeota archaeon]